MAKQRKIPVQFRYYDMPLHQHAFALLGESWRRNYGNDVNELHFHNHMEIGICHDGDGILIVEEKSMGYHGGMISVLPQNTLHTTISSKNRICFWEYLYIDVEGFFREYYRDDVRKAEKMAALANARAGFFEKDEIPKIYRLAEAIMEEERDKKHDSIEIVNGILGALLLTIARGNRKLEQKPARTNDKLKQIIEALGFLEKNYKDEILVEDLAAICHMSETHFRRLFGECMHMTPLEYINFIRVEKACELIRYTNYSMEMIAEKTGFQSQSSFIRNFKEYREFTPYQWKKRLQKEEQETVEVKISAYKGW